MIFKKSKYYTNIDNCNILLYNDILTGKQDIKNLCYLGHPSVKKCFVHWKNIKNQIISEFGISLEYQDYIKLQQEICENIYQYRVNGNRTSLAVIAMLETKATKYNSMFNVKENISNACAKLSKEYAFRINPADFSIREYYSYLTV